MRQFFHKFCARFVDALYSSIIRWPDQHEVSSALVLSIALNAGRFSYAPCQMDFNLKEYATLGFPGCIASTDGVHIGWTNCPYQWRLHFSGKEKIPTVAFNVCCNHRRWIHAITVGHPGGRNDKTISRMDDFLTAVKESEFFTNREFELLSKDNLVIKVKGVWVLCDGGYLRWRIMQCPLKPENLCDDDEIAWSERAESVRKDVECLFGVLKARFRLLKLPLLCCGKDGHEKVMHIFYTCCMLHNMLLEFDGLMDWEADVDWSSTDGFFDENTPGCDPCSDFTTAGHQDRTEWNSFRDEGDDDTVSVGDWNELRAMLVEHYANPNARAAMAWNTLHMGRMR
jgi:hypothetical protein